MIPSMDTLQLFIEVARCRSFSEAARLQGMTQPAASQRIRALESHLQVKLLDRSVRPLALTGAGQHFLEGCLRVIESYEQVEREVRSLDQGLSGQVRVSAIYSAGIELLDQIHEQFIQAHPNINVDIRYEKPDRVYRSVLEQERDLGIVSYPQRWRHVGIIPFREEVMSVVCSPDHGLAAVEKVQAQQLSAYEMVSFDSDLPVSRRVKQYLNRQNAHPAVKHTFDNIDTIKNAVAVSNRFAILPQRTAKREVKAGTLAVVGLEPGLTRPLGIIYRKPSRDRHGSFSPTVQAFVDFLPKVDDPIVPLAQEDDHAKAVPLKGSSPPTKT